MLLKLMLEPIFTVSRTDSEEPKVVEPNTDSDDPRRAKFLIEHPLPKLANASTLKDAPREVTPRTDMLLPTCT
jgi:hypothetical protein